MSCALSRATSRSQCNGLVGSARELGSVPVSTGHTPGPASAANWAPAKANGHRDADVGLPKLLSHSSSSAECAAIAPRVSIRRMNGQGAAAAAKAAAAMPRHSTALDPLPLPPPRPLQPVLRQAPVEASRNSARHATFEEPAPHPTDALAPHPDEELAPEDDPGALWASAALRLSNVQQQPRPARAVNNSAPVAASVAKPSSAPAVAAKFVQGLSKSGRMAVDQMTDAADYSAKHVAEAIDMVTTKTGVPLPSATAKYFELRKKQKASWKQVIVHKTVLGIEIFGKDSSHLLPTEDHLTCRGSRLPNLPGQVTMRVLYESALCHIVRTSAIVLSFLQEVCKTQFDPSGQGAGSFWSICNVVFLVIFTIELACNLYSGWNLKSFWRAGFNIFDIVLVTVGLVMTLHQAGETNSLADDDTDSTESEVFMILRALRLLRCLRIFRRSRTFQIVVLAVRRALVPIGILIFFMSLYSVIGVTIFRTAVVTTMAQYTDLGNEYGDEYWGNWLAAMLTLFQVFTLENWSAIARPLIFNESWQTSVLAILFFPSFIMINAILVLDLVTSFFVDTVQNEDIQKEFDRKQFEAAHAKAEKVGARHFSQKLKDQLKIKRQHERLEEVRKKTMSIDAKTVEKVGRLVDDLVKRRLAEATGQSPGSALRPVKQPALNLSAAALSRSAGIAAHGSRPCSPGRTCSPSLDELSENSLSFTQQ